MRTKLIILFLLVSYSVLAMPDKMPGMYVSDFVSAIPNNVKMQMESQFAAFDRQTSIEIAVAVVPTLEGMDPNQYSTALFNKWGIGKKSTNNGVLIMWCPSERSYFVTPGYGMEGVLTDADCRKLIDAYWLPSLKAGNGADGLLNFTKEIIKFIGPYAPEQKREYLAAQAKIDQENFVSAMWSIVYFIVGCGIFAFLYFQWRKEKKEKQRLEDAKAKLVGVVDEIKGMEKRLTMLMDVPKYKMVFDMLSSFKSEYESKSSINQSMMVAKIDDLEMYNKKLYDKISDVSQAIAKLESENVYRSKMLKYAGSVNVTKNAILDGLSFATETARLIESRWSKSVWNSGANLNGDIFQILNTIPQRLADVTKNATDLENAARAWDLHSAQAIEMKIVQALNFGNIVSAPSSVMRKCTEDKEWLTQKVSAVKNLISSTRSAVNSSDVSSSTKSNFYALEKELLPDPASNNPITERQRVESLISKLENVKSKAGREKSEAESDRSTSPYSSISIGGSGGGGYGGGGGYSGGGGMSGGAGAGGTY